jgi:hypothetical protein
MNNYICRQSYIPIGTYRWFGLNFQVMQRCITHLFIAFQAYIMAFKAIFHCSRFVRAGGAKITQLSL